ncbi:MAG: putative 4-hydroxybenzoate polyprenyltransferase [Planctomycetes bacterium]|nr:putative 4-hydroxybenzoate polyprenyltransferase [Planctomycetota bacterium]
MHSTASPVVALARDIKLSHSIFALPFALLATFLAAAHGGGLPGWDSVVLIVACMVLARTFAMSVNRWADARIDRENPRTAGRAIPAGRVSASFVLTAAIVCAAGTVVAASGFWVIHDNPWPVIASPLVLGWLALYSFTKRFTWFCHLVLGVALALSPLAATLAITPEFLASKEPYLLALMVACWVAGFDVIYALQDVEMDRKQGLHSMPSRLGVEPALWVSRLLHAGSLAALVVLARTSPHLHILFAVGVGLVAALLVLEHALVWGSKTHRINMAFFTVNGVISLLLGGLGIIDVIRSL